MGDHPSSAVLHAVAENAPRWLPGLAGGRVDVVVERRSRRLIDETARAAADLRANVL